MTALTSASWTLTVLDTIRTGKKKWVFGTLLLAATDTYPDGGVPLPVIGQFGFAVRMDALILFGVDPTTGTVAEYHTRWDKTNHKLLIFEEEAAAAGGPLLEADTGEVPGARTWNFLAIGS